MPPCRVRLSIRCRRYVHARFDEKESRLRRAVHHAQGHSSGGPCVSNENQNGDPVVNCRRSFVQWILLADFSVLYCFAVDLDRGAAALAALVSPVHLAPARPARPPTPIRPFCAVWLSTRLPPLVSGPLWSSVLFVRACVRLADCFYLLITGC